MGMQGIPRTLELGLWPDSSGCSKLCPTSLLFPLSWSHLCIVSLCFILAYSRSCSSSSNSWNVLSATSAAPGAPLGRSTMQTAEQSSLRLLNHIFYTSGTVRTATGNQLNKTQVKLPITAEKQANFCSLYLSKLLSALCTSNTNLAQKQHTEKCLLQSAGLRHLKSVRRGKKGCFYFCQFHAEACHKGHSRSIVRPKWTINFF